MGHTLSTRNLAGGADRASESEGEREKERESMCMRRRKVHKETCVPPKADALNVTGGWRGAINPISWQGSRL